MHFIAFLIFGLLAGAIAKWILPGKQGGGWLGSLVCGVLGAWVGGALGGMILEKNPLSDKLLTNPMAWLFAIIGALIVLVVWGFIKSKILNKA